VWSTAYNSKLASSSISEPQPRPAHRALRQHSTHRCAARHRLCADGTSTTDSPTCFFPAMCMTPSTWWSRSASLTSSRSRMLPTTSGASGTRRGSPVERSSSTTTSIPSATMADHVRTDVSGPTRHQPRHGASLVAHRPVSADRSCCRMGSPVTQKSGPRPLEPRGRISGSRYGPTRSRHQRWTLAALRRTPGADPRLARRARSGIS